MANILIVDDDQNILRVVRCILRKEYHSVDTKSNLTNTSLRDFQGYDLILFEVMMPNINGYEVCEKIVDVSECPVLILSKATSEDDKVRGLEAGADDYITKPFGNRELAARVRVHLRRAKKGEKKKRIVADGITFDFNLKEIYIENEKVNLTNYEYKICEILIQNRSKTFTKENIYDALYDVEANAQFRTITEFIYSIRKKFSAFNIEPIKTVWGVGYRWEVRKLEKPNNKGGKNILEQ